MIGGYIGKPIGGIVGDDSRTATLSVTLDSIALTAVGALALKGSLSKTLDNVGLTITGALALKGSLSAALDDATLAATVDYSALFGSLGITLDDARIIQFDGSFVTSSRLQGRPRKDYEYFQGRGLYSKQGRLPPRGSGKFG